MLHHWLLEAIPFSQYTFYLLFRLYYFFKQELSCTHQSCRWIPFCSFNRTKRKMERKGLNSEQPSGIFTSSTLKIVCLVLKKNICQTNKTAISTLKYLLYKDNCRSRQAAWIIWGKESFCFSKQGIATVCDTCGIILDSCFSLIAYDYT